MKDTLVSQMSHEASFAVSADMSPPHLPVQVLSTPSMVGLIEGACLQLVAPHLSEGETSVGTHICVSHSGLAMVGETVVVSCELTSVDRRRLSFAVTVRSPRGVISEGTHERAVVDSSKFG